MYKVGLLSNECLYKNIIINLIINQLSLKIVPFGGHILKISVPFLGMFSADTAFILIVYSQVSN